MKIINVSIVVGLILAACYGWLCNVIHLVNTEVMALSGELVIRVIGVLVFPIGAVMGYV